MHEKFLKPYDASATESRIYAAWEKSGLFNPDECVKQGVTLANAPPYSIVLPPPNVTGRLHMGHALMLAVQDILIRYKRMRGFHTLWVPGTDQSSEAPIVFIWLTIVSWLSVANFSMRFRSSSRPRSWRFLPSFL